jgi:hypothetical protein
MPTYVDAKAAAKMIKEAQQLEVMLAWDLLETFNTTPELIDTLRGFVNMALEEMFTIAVLNEKEGKAAVEESIKSEKGKGNQVVKRLIPGNSKLKIGHTIAEVTAYSDLPNLIADVPKLDAQNCSDIIRLYGEVVEALAKKGDPNKLLKADYKKLMEDKEKVKQGLKKDDQQAFDDIWGQLPKGANDKVLAEFIKTHPFGRHRLNPPKEAIAWINQKRFFNVHDFLVSMKGGIAAWEQQSTSTLEKVNHLFGLAAGADISGTTTDTVFFFNKFKGAAALDPIFLMLPLATIVAGAHHSLQEVAFALSLAPSPVINYSIGFYGTLMPQRNGLADHKGIKEIKAALDAADKHANHHNMLITYKDVGVVDGAFVITDKKELLVFKTQIAAHEKALEIGQAAPKEYWPSKSDVEAIFKKAKLT